MNRKELQTLAKLRIKEAEVLLRNKQYDGAYYLCGYGVECALKACIAKNTKRYEFPDKQTVLDSYSHDFVKLARIAGLETDLKNELDTNPDFKLYWTTAKDWSEKSRYKRNVKSEAQMLLKAIIDPNNGILRWIEKFW